MPKLPKVSQLTSKGKQRFVLYALAIAVIAGIAVATLISLNVITADQFDNWLVQVGVTVPALVGLVTSVLALFNIEKAPDQLQSGADSETGRRAAEQ